MLTDEQVRVLRRIHKRECHSYPIKCKNYAATLMDLYKSGLLVVINDWALTDAARRALAEYGEAEE